MQETMNRIRFNLFSISACSKKKVGKVILKMEAKWEKWKCLVPGWEILYTQMRHDMALPAARTSVNFICIAKHSHGSV